MNKIINGKRYDTKTAFFVCSDGQLNVNGCTRCTDLYKKKTGEFFFHHMSMWQGENDSIIPVDGVPMEFLEENMSADGIEKLLNIKFEE
jgi:hypothetical protein